MRTESSERDDATPGPDLSRELTVAADLAREAGRILLECRARGVTVEYKGHDDPVTVADRASSALIVEGLSRAFPGDGILCEETPDGPDRRSRRRVWIIDPMDGTKDFVLGTDEFAVMIGLAIEGRAVLGVVHQPSTAVTLRAAPGAGATIERAGRVERLQPLGALPSVAGGFVLAVSRTHRSAHHDELTRHLPVREEVRMGSVGLKVGLVVTGRCDAYLGFTRRTKEWDTCAGQAILESLGGVMTDLAGEPLTYNRADVVNQNGVIASGPGNLARLVDASAAVAASGLTLE